MSQLAIFVLGSPRIEIDGEPVDINRRKAVALLAYLAVTGKRHSRDTLATLFWPESDQTRARAALRRTLSILNSDLEPWLEIDRETAGFQPDADIRLDTARFRDLVAGWLHAGQPTPEQCAACLEPLTEAANLYQDDFMAGFTLPDCPDFDEWQFFQREGLRQELAAGLEQLIACHSAQGALEPALTYARRRLRLDSLHEPAHRQLMRLYAQAGQRAAALRQYEECERILDQELSVSPAAETRALYQEIQAGTLSHQFDPQPAEVKLPAPSLSPTPPPAGAGQTIFVAREPELAHLNRFLKTVRAGQGQIAFVVGEAGSGKTALVREFIRQAQEKAPDLVAAVGDCNAHTGLGDPYLPFRQVLGLLTGDTENGLNRGVVSQENFDRLRRLLPQSRRLAAEFGPHLVDNLVPGAAIAVRTSNQGVGQNGGALTQHDILEQISRVLHVIAAQQPLLLALEDFQWADAASINLLFHLGRRLDQAPILLLVTYRPDDLALGRENSRHPLEPVINELKRLHGDIQIDLSRSMDRAFVDALLDAEPNELGEAFRAALYRRTGGHPLFTVELLRDMQERGDLVQNEECCWIEKPALEWQALPARVEAVIAERVSRLAADLRDILSVASIEGEFFTAQLIAQVQQVPERQVLRLLAQELEKGHRLVQEQGEITGGGQPLSRYRFAHFLFQQYLYQALSAGERRLLHGEVAAALELLYAEQTDDIRVQLAHHYAEAGQGEKAIDHLLAAGDKARDLSAYSEAISLYRQALSFLEAQGSAGRERAARTLMKLGLTYHLAFDFKQARQSYEKGFTLWQWAGRSRSASRPAAPHALRLTEMQPATLDPTMAGDRVSISIIDQLFSGLMALRPEMEVVPEIARSWEMRAGGREYLFHLRDDARWTDGRAVTANDFVYAWRQTLRPETRSPVAGLLYDVKGARALHRGETTDPACLGVRALDPFTLLVEMEGPTGYLPQLLANNATYPLPRHVVERYGPAWTEPENMVTNGAFRLETWQPEQWATFVRNPAYQGQSTGNVEGVKVYLSRDAATELALYEDDELDVVYMWQLSSVEQDLTRQRYADEYVVGPGLDTVYAGFNAGRSPFDDVRLRRAFVLATDRETLANVVLRGYATPALGGFVPPGMPGHSAGIGLPFDPDRARQLLAEAGYPGGHGFPRDLDWFIRASDKTVADYLRDQWSTNLGLDLRWQVRNWEKVYRLPNQAFPHIFQMGWIADYLDSDNFLRLGLSHVHEGWQNETYQALLERAREMADPARRLDLHRQADRLLIEEAPVLPLTYMRRHLLVKPWISRFPTSAIKKWFWKDIIIEPH